jgi:F420-non-reducing hydrogenase large subunit
MTILTFPMSRIEGHARVVIEEEGGVVQSADFQAMELRGFRYFVVGTPAEQMPVIVPRICGVCSTAHHVASVKALEDLYGVTPPPIAEKIREILLLGQLIQNQATSLFLFTMPDRIGVDSIFAAEDLDCCGTDNSNLAMSSLRVRKAGTDLITVAGGQFIHPIQAVIGGVIRGIERERADAMIKELDEILPVAKGLFDCYWNLSLALRDRIGTWGDDEPTYYLASTQDDELTLNSERLRVLDPAGKEKAGFKPRDYQKYLIMEESRYSYAGESSFQGQIIRANSLARMNMARKLDTPEANSYLQRFKQEFGDPAHAILFFDICRGIELVYAIEKARRMLEGDLEHEDVKVGYSIRDGVGYGLVEAPRGPLIHRYEVENGLIKEADFVIPTAHNMRAIRRALMVVANRYISPNGINLELDKAVGRVVRAFDPCIACATQ